MTPPTDDSAAPLGDAYVESKRVIGERAFTPEERAAIIAQGAGDGRETFRTVTRDGFGVGFAFTTRKAAQEQADEFDRTNADQGPHRVQQRSGWQEVGA